MSRRMLEAYRNVQSEESSNMEEKAQITLHEQGHRTALLNGSIAVQLGWLYGCYGLQPSAAAVYGLLQLHEGYRHSC